MRLGYCTNVHPGETVEAVEETLGSVTVDVKRRVSPDAPIGVGLWLAAGVARTLAADAGRRAAFADSLETRGIAPFTLNAFPYGGFHEARVKERVFRPSWATSARLDYTRDCARVLAALLPPGATGSISTVPLGMRAAGFSDADRAAATAALRAFADELATLESETGRRVVLALEPEPRAELETIAQAATYLDEEVFGGGGAAARRHLGVCIDACHEAVLFQPPETTVEACVARGVTVGKVQVTSALELARPASSPDAVSRLATFDEGRYFHQVAARRPEGVEVWPDLDAFLRGGATDDAVEVVRVHFHVPVFAAPEGGLTTTRGELARLLRAVTAAGLTDQFEVETYTFGVVPLEEREALGADSLAGAIARELEWSRDALAV